MVMLGLLIPSGIGNLIPEVIVQTACRRRGC